MTLTKTKRALAAVLVFVILISLSMFTSFAAEKKASHKRSGAQYTNPETGYQVLIKDDDDLLSSSDEKKLVEEMMPLTEYGHAILWTTNINVSDYLEQARKERKACYEYDSASIFMINVGSRNICIQSYGTLYRYLSGSIARTITDNVSHYATAGDYYTCAKEAFTQMTATAHGEKIAEPMKITSYIVISIVLGLMIALAVAFSKKFNPLRKSIEPPETKGSGTMMATPLNMVLIKTDTIHVSSSSGGFGGGGGGGGGSSF